MSSLNPSPAPQLRAPFTLKNLAVDFFSSSQQRLAQDLTQK